MNTKNNQAGAMLIRFANTIQNVLGHRPSRAVGCNSRPLGPIVQKNSVIDGERAIGA